MTLADTPRQAEKLGVGGSDKGSKVEMFDKQQLVKIAQYKMPFGKYAGRELIKLPEEYLLWFANGDGFPDGELGELMALCLEIRVAGLEKLIWPLLPKSN